MAKRTRLGQWWTQRTPGREFWWITGATLLFNGGVSIYLFLYSLFLLDRGYTEKTVGLLTSAMVLGGLAGTLPTGMLARRWGLRRVLAATLAATGGLLAVRVLWMWYPAQVVSSFLAGVAMCGWMVCASPAVANAVDEERRPLAFGILYAAAIAVGCGGGLLGGFLPQFLAHVALSRFGVVLGAATAKQSVLWLGALLVAFAALPALKIRAGTAAASVRLAWPGCFLRRFLIASAVWAAAVGLVNPFAGPFFVKHLAMPVEHVGAYFSGAQLVQAAAVLLLGPWVLRRMGVLPGMLATQAATGIALIWVVAGHGLIYAEVFYCVFMSAQHMSETGVQTLLMNRTPEASRSDAAAMNYLVVALGQSCAAAVAGFALSAYGYPWLFRASGVLVIVAAVVFRLLCADAGELETREVESVTSAVVN